MDKQQAQKIIGKRDFGGNPDGLGNVAQ